MEEKLSLGLLGSWVRGEARNPAMVRRVRPWRRSGDEHSEAMVELLSGKATVDRLGIRLGVNLRTVEKWREAAIGEY
jgi:hypothetical protein